MNEVSFLSLFWEFFKIGLFAVGGGPATLPFFVELSHKFNWFSLEELTNMIAISESTPGPLGINMATYVGYRVGGIPGGIIATMGLVFPSIIIITIIAAFFERFSKDRHVMAAFYGIRPAVTAVIAISVFGICRVTLFNFVNGHYEPVIKSLAFCAVIFLLLQIKKFKKIHPFFWFVIGALFGTALGFLEDFKIIL